MEKPVAQNSGMVVKAERSGTVTFVDAMRILWTMLMIMNCASSMA